MHCRGCNEQIDDQNVFVDLGALPLANALLSKEDLSRPESYWPLKVLVCGSCYLVQLDTHVPIGALFPHDYPFRSGVSGPWLQHCKEFADMIVKRAGLTSTSNVLEIGSNDGAGLLRFRYHGIPAMGIDPAYSASLEANLSGIATLNKSWTPALSTHLRDEIRYQASLVIARNVLAHTPDPVDFLWAIRNILAPAGVAVLETPHIGHMIRDSRWDQIYHEHHFYYSLISLQQMLHRVGLIVVDVEYIPTHGGSMRVYVARLYKPVLQDLDAGKKRVKQALEEEKQGGLAELGTYISFARIPRQAKEVALRTVVDNTSQGGHIVGYGASAKAATFLNYYGIGTEHIPAIVDITPAKWGKYVPGVRIPIFTDRAKLDPKPDVVYNFCWNWRKESRERIRRIAPDAMIMDFGHR